MSQRLDNFQTAFFARELEYIKAQTYDVLYPELKATTLIPVSNEASEGVETITYQQFDKVGTAKVISDYADDVPRADIRGKEFREPVRSIGSSFGYSVQEIRAAAYAGRNLEARKAEAARRAVEQTINTVGFFGDANAGLTGFFNNTSVSREAAPLNAGSSSRLWVNKTGEEILADMNNLANGIIDTTFGVEAPNTILLPIEQYTLIATKNAGTGTDSTILQYFLNNSPTVDSVEWVNEAKNAGLGTGAVVAGNDIMVAYNRNPNKLTYEIPMPFQMEAPEQRGYEFIVFTEARVSSVAVRYPKSIAIMEGI